MALILGLLVAGSYGAADFFGGWASRRSPAGAVTVATQFVGLVVLVGFVVVDAAPWPADADIVLGLVIGVIGVGSIACLYRGFAVGRMSVVAPIAAVGAGAIPVVWGLGTGERPGAVALVGVVLALGAVVLIARVPGEPVDPGRGGFGQVALAVAAGLGFGVSVVLFAETSPDSGFWPALAARCSSVPVGIAVLAVARRTVVPYRGDVRPVVAAGALDALANALILLALRRGLVSIVAPVAALGPAATILLARVVLGEQVAREQRLGLGLAFVGLVCIGTA